MTSRQFYIMLWITTISLKVQKLPAMIYDGIGKDGYLLLFAYLVVDVVGICMAFFILKRIKGEDTLNEQNSSRWLNFFKRLLVFVVAVYFLIQALLLYEAIENLFEHILFDNLSWMIFSLLLLICVFYLAHTGIRNIAKNFELYFIVIVVSYIIISIFGATKADFSAILPFQTVNIDAILGKFISFNLWFGDFFLILFMGNHAKDIKLKWTLLTYVLAIFFLVLLFVELNGIYGVYTSMKPSLITTITEQSVLGVNIGRVDWFLILFTEIGTILSCGVCIYFAKKCLSFAFPKVKSFWLLVLIMVGLYFVNVFYLLDTHMREVVFTGYMGYIAAGTKWGTFVLMFISCLFKRKKQTPPTPAHEEINGSEATKKFENTKTKQLATSKTKKKINASKPIVLKGGGDAYEK